MSDILIAVLIGAPEKLDVKSVGQIISWFRKIPALDAQRIAKHCWGIVADDLDKKGGDELVARFQEAGIPATSVPADLIATLAPAKLAAKAVWTEDGLEFTLREGGGTTAFPFSRIAGVCAAAFEETHVHKVEEEKGPTAGQQAANMGILLTTGLPIKIGGQKRKVEREVQSSDLVFYMDVVLEDPDARIRIDGQRFDFSLLGAEKQYNILGNLRTLTIRLAAKALKAVRSRGTRVLVESRPIREMGYSGMHDLERETRWLLTLARRAGGSKNG